MPRQTKPRTILGFDPYGYNRYLLPTPAGNPHLAHHYLGTADVWVQIDNDYESFHLDQYGEYWELSRDGSLLARALAERLPSDSLAVGEMLLGELWCTRWPVAIALMGFDDTAELGVQRWARIKTTYDQHTEKNWPPKHVKQVLETKELMRRAMIDDEQGKIWAVDSCNNRDARLCLNEGIACNVRRRDDRKTFVLEFHSFNGFRAFRASSKSRAKHSAWIQHSDGRIQDAGGDQ